MSKRQSKNANFLSTVFRKGSLSTGVNKVSFKKKKKSKAERKELQKVKRLKAIIRSIDDFIKKESSSYKVNGKSFKRFKHYRLIDKFESKIRNLKRALIRSELKKQNHLDWIDRKLNYYTKILETSLNLIEYSSVGMTNTKVPIKLNDKELNAVLAKYESGLHREIPKVNLDACDDDEAKFICFHCSLKFSTKLHLKFHKCAPH